MMTRSRVLRTTPAIPKPSSRVLVRAGLAAAALAGCGVAFAVQSSRNSKARWKGRTVVITGGSRGLGFALAREFARAGANIVLAARDEDELLRARQLLIQQHPAGAKSVVKESQIQVVPCDLTSREAAEALLSAAHERWSRVDVLVNNAGIIRVGPVATQTVEDFTDAMNTNFYAMLYCTWAALPRMTAQGGGDIINISSIGGKIAVPHMLSYSASKFAAAGFSQGLHTEMKPHGIHVTTIFPGLLRTGSHLNAEFKGRHDEEYRWFSLGATLPLVAVDAARAAKLIVSAATRRDAELIISPQAAIAARLAGLMPGTTAFVLTLVNRLLPGDSGVPSANESRPGWQSRGREIRATGQFGDAAADRYNEDGDHSQSFGKIW